MHKRSLWKKQWRGFTLIELLIVVAIIGILAAIAVPNFLNAQIRSKVARTIADMRNTGTAIESFRLDRSVLLLDFWDDDEGWAITRWQEQFRGVGPRPPYKRNYENYYPLTSPVSYLTAPPIDPFIRNEYASVGFGANEVGNSYIYFDRDPRGGGIGIGMYAEGYSEAVKMGIRPLQLNEFAMLSLGPDNFIGVDSNGNGRGIPYDSSNGVASRGDLVFRSGGGK